MSELLGRISETRESRDKATKAHVDKVRKLLKERGHDEKVSIPECIFGEDTQYDWEAITVMSYVLLSDNEKNQEYTIGQAEMDTGQHTIRIMAPEIAFFYGEKINKAGVVKHWDRIFEIVDSYDTCPDCNRTRIPAWFFCGWCGIQLRSLPEEEGTEEVPEETVENPIS